MASASREPAPAGPAAPIRVSELGARLGRVLDEAFPASIRVVGEVSGFRERTHWYFDLKDRDAVVSCVMFASAARKASRPPENGEEVVVSARVEFYAKGGKTTLVVGSLRPSGEGALERAYRELCDSLRALGWFDESRKRPLPAFPGRVAIITSRTGAALQDVLDTMRRRCPAVGIVLLDVRVQGDGAAGEVAAALRWVSHEHERQGIDAVLVTRGGGSREDLWAFNERVVAEAIVHCAVPVVAAIGHETDTTIAELTADVRAATPTQGAMRLTPDSAALLEQVESLSRRLHDRVDRLRARAADRLAGLARRPVVRDPGEMVVRRRERVDDAGLALARAVRSLWRERLARAERWSATLERLGPGAGLARRTSKIAQAGLALRSAGRARTSEASARLEVLGARLEALGPGRVLARGYSLTLRADGRAVRSVDEVRVGERVRTHVADGSFTSRIEGSKGARRETRAQLDLFAGGE